MRRRKPLREQVVVVTGATSGIGLATVEQLARAGARVVMVARGADDLKAIAVKLTSQGQQVTTCVADVGDKSQTKAAADHAFAAYGGFDTWVNVAGLTIYGLLKDVSEADNLRLMQTNFWGTVHGSLIAADHFRRRSGGGAIINVGSVASDLAFPRQGIYAASKHAVKGFTDALRMKMMEEGAPIDVTLLKPNSIDSPLPQRARNYFTREPMLPPPIYPPEEVAHAIAESAHRPVRELVVGGGGVPLIALRRALPAVYDRIGPAISFFEERNLAARNPEGALHAPQRSARLRGDQPGYVMRTSLYTRAALMPAVPLALAVLGGLVVAGLAASRRR